MKNKKNDDFSHNLEKKIEPLAQELGKVAERKLEPFTKVVTLLSFMGASVFLIISLARGSYEGSLVRLPFLPTTDATVTYIVAAVIFIITIWHLISTIRFFAKRSNKK